MRTVGTHRCALLAVECHSCSQHVTHASVVLVSDAFASPARLYRRNQSELLLDKHVTAKHDFSCSWWWCLHGCAGDAPQDLPLSSSRVCMRKEAGIPLGPNPARLMCCLPRLTRLSIVGQKLDAAAVSQLCLTCTGLQVKGLTLATYCDEYAALPAWYSVHWLCYQALTT